MDKLDKIIETHCPTNGLWELMRLVKENTAAGSFLELHVRADGEEIEFRYSSIKGNVALRIKPNRDFLTDDEVAVKPTLPVGIGDIELLRQLRDFCPANAGLNLMELGAAVDNLLSSSWLTVQRFIPDTSTVTGVPSCECWAWELADDRVEAMVYVPLPYFTLCYMPQHD